MSPKALLIGFCLIFLSAVAFFFPKNRLHLYNTINETPSYPPEEAVNPDESLGIVLAPPDGWKMYSDNMLGIRLYYPENLTFEKNGANGVIFIPASNIQGQGPTTFFYISVIPKSQEKANGTIYNYRFKDVATLETLEIGQGATLTENRELDEWYKYQRLNDKEIAGKTAKQFVNLKPWEFPVGTQETRYIFKEGDNTYLVGVYNNLNNELLNKKDIDQMLNSFSIINPEQEILE